jgi:hypothetical protein
MALYKKAGSVHWLRSLVKSPGIGMSLTKVSLGGNCDVIYKLFLPRESLISDIPDGDGNIEQLFYGVRRPIGKPALPLHIACSFAAHFCTSATRPFT